MEIQVYLACIATSFFFVFCTGQLEAWYDLLSDVHPTQEQILSGNWTGIACAHSAHYCCCSRYDPSFVWSTLLTAAFLAGCYPIAEVQPQSWLIASCNRSGTPVVWDRENFDMTDEEYNVAPLESVMAPVRDMARDHHGLACSLPHRARNECGCPNVRRHLTVSCARQNIECWQPFRVDHTLPFCEQPARSAYAGLMSWEQGMRRVVYWLVINHVQLFLVWLTFHLYPSMPSGLEKEIAKHTRQQKDVLSEAVFDEDEDEVEAWHAHRSISRPWRTLRSVHKLGLVTGGLAKRKVVKITPPGEPAALMHLGSIAEGSSGPHSPSPPLELHGSPSPSIQARSAEIARRQEEVDRLNERVASLQQKQESRFGEGA